MERVLSPGTETSQASDLSRSEIGYDQIRGPTSPEERELCEERERERDATERIVGGWGWYLDACRRRTTLVTKMMTR